MGSHKEAVIGQLKVAAVLGATILALWAAQAQWAPQAEGRRAARHSDGIAMQPPVTERELAQLREARLRALAGG
jgi:hypothetical protein